MREEERVRGTAERARVRSSFCTVCCPQRGVCWVRVVHTDDFATSVACTCNKLGDKSWCSELQFLTGLTQLCASCLCCKT